MQTTLLGLAIAIILALVTALVAPLFVDWTQYRSAFEAEASRLAGMQVRVKGGIEASILPVPSVTLRDVDAGPAGAAPRLHAGSVGVRFALGPLLRGEWRAVDVQVKKPEFDIGINSTGRIDWPAMAVGFRPDALSIEKFDVDDGRAVLTDALSGARAVIEQLSFSGDVRSLRGPFKGDGGFVYNGEFYPYQVATGRADDNGLKLRASIDATAERPLSTSVDGVLTFEDSGPHFVGGLVSARPAGVAGQNGKAQLNEPWRLTGRIDATPAAALLEKLDFHYGNEDSGISLAGAAKWTFGEHPRVEGTLSAHRVDLDRLTATLSAPTHLPLAELQTLVQQFRGAVRPGIPLQLQMSVDNMTLGGAALQTVGGDLRSDGQDWMLDRLEFRGPGFSQVGLSGRLAFDADGPVFNGAGNVDATDPNALFSWLAGDPAPASASRPLHARGDLQLASGRIAIERLRATIDRQSIEGKLAYRWAQAGHPAKLDAEIKAADLDVDSILAFSRSALPAGIEKPGEIVLGLEAGKATFAGVEAKKASVRLKASGTGIEIERLTVADFGGAALEASGTIDTSGTPHGTMTLAIDARDFAGIDALAGRYAPSLSASVARLRQSFTGGAKLRATLGVGDGTPGARFAVQGTIGAIRLALDASATALPKLDTDALKDFGQLRFNAALDSDDGAALLALGGLDRSAMMAAKGPGHLTLNADGPAAGTLRVDTRLAAGAIDIAGKGTLNLSGDRIVRLNEVSGTAWGSALRGSLAITPGSPLRVDGKVDLDTMDAPRILGAVMGARATPPGKDNRAENWSVEPFAGGVLGGLGGHLAFAAQRATFAPSLAAAPLRGDVSFDDAGITIDKLDGEMGGGKLSGTIKFGKGSGGLSAKGSLALRGADAVSVLPAKVQGAITGKLGVDVALEGAGLSPAAFVGSLSGTGTLTLDNAAFGDLDTRAFDSTVRAVDRGVAVDNAKINDLMSAALARGRLRVASLKIPLAIAAGRGLLEQTSVHADGADLTVGGMIDLTNATLNAKVGVVDTNGAAANGGRINLAIRGPLSEPKRTLDVAEFTEWLALRAVERQSKRLEAIQSSRRDSASEDDPAPAPTSAPAAVPSTLVPSTSSAPNAAPPVPRPAPPVHHTTPHARTSETGPAPAAAPALPPPLEIRPAPRPLQRPVSRRALPAAPEPPAPQPAPRPSSGLPFGLFGTQR